MIDQMFDRAYQQGRADLNASLKFIINRIAKAALDSFRVLNRIEYDSPWLSPQRKGRHA